jgi:hypothetical protein
MIIQRNSLLPGRRRAQEHARRLGNVCSIRSARTASGRKRRRMTAPSDLSIQVLLRGLTCLYIC